MHWTPVELASRGRTRGKTQRWMVAVAIASFAGAPSARAADQFVPGTKLLLKSSSTTEKLIFVSRGSFSMPSPGSGDAPTNGGATLEVLNPGTMEAFTFDMPSAHWTASGGGTVYRYIDSASVEPGKVRVALVGGRLLKISGRKAGITLNEPSQGVLDVVLTAGAFRYCARFDGASVKKDGPGRFSARKAPAPGSCPTPPPSTSTTMTTTTATVTTTSVSGQTTTTTVGGPTTTTTVPPGCDCCCFGQFAFTTGLPQIGSGGCANTGGVTSGTVMDDTGAPLCNLAAGGLYFGGAGVGIPLPAAIPDQAASIAKLANCNAGAGTFNLTATTASDTGSNRDCTSASVTNPEYPGKPGCLFGPPLPIPNTNSPATSVCIVNRVSSDASGAGTCGNGGATLNIPLSSDIYLTGPTDGLVPCPRCAGPVGSETCQAGPNAGVACTPSDSASLGGAYPTSHDCPPATGAFIGSLPIPFALTTGTQTKTSADLPAQQFVFCGFCGQQFAPSFQGPPAVPCTADSQCTNPTFPKCRQRTSGAFGQGPARTIIETGSPAGVCVDDAAPHAANLVSVFCVPPTFNSTVDAAGDLPGPGAVSLTGVSQLISPIPLCTTTTLAGTTTSTSIPTTTSSTVSPVSTTSTSTSTSSTVTTTTLPACPPPALPVGSLSFTIAQGTTSCGGPGLTPGPATPVSGEIDGTGGKISDLGLDCLYLGGGINGTVPGVTLPDASTAILDISGMSGLNLTLSASNGTGPDNCTRGAGPGRHCANGSAGTGGGACTSDADCGQSHACVLDANCFFGAPAPVPAGPLSSCALNAIATDPCGSATLGGAATLTVGLSSRFYLTGDAPSPCPRCVAGTCTAGARAGQSCSGGVGSKLTTRECPPSPAQFIGELPISLSPLSTGTSTLTNPTGFFCPGQKVPGAFGQTAATTIRETGSPLLGGGSLFSTTLAGNFCIPATGTPLIDNTVDLPGPGAVSVPGTISVCLLGLLCL